MASLNELARLLPRLGGRVEVHVIVYEPSVKPAGWNSIAITNRVRQIVGKQIQLDPDGCLALKFRAYTSGDVLLYRPNGELAFCGGVTSARGHEGESNGTDAIFDWVTKGAGARTVPVYGCAMQSTWRDDGS
jgi:hypothetical protein